MDKMQNLAEIATIASKAGQNVSLRGWISNIRSSGKLYFLEFRDGSGFIQCVVDTAALNPAQAELVKSATRESSAIVSGTVLPHPKHPNQFELRVESFELVHLSEEFPIGRKDHGPDFLLENRHLWLRSKRQWAIQRIRNTIINATYDFFNREGFIKIDSPIITANACEGTTTLFEVEYFDLGKAYLSQSGQLYLEACIAAHGKVFDFGPVFRAEKSKTRKHLTEFWMMDAEMAFYTHQENMALQEQLITFIVQSVLQKNRSELTILERNVAMLEKINAPFPKITHKEAVSLLRERGSEITEDSDLGAKDEEILAQIYDVPVFIEKWPSDIKAFYMKRDPENPSVVLAADLMAPEGFGELIGGSQREDQWDVLLEKAKEENLPLESFQWYLDLRRYGSVPHSGFGFGLERLVAWITGVEHIRETIPFPRMIYRISP